jgi:hypothetical protein
LPKGVVDFEVSVYNAVGQRCFHAKNSTQIDLRTESNGIFVIELKSKAGIFNGKLVKY